METPLSPEIQLMIRRHLVHGCSQSPEAVIKKALDALNAQEAQAALHGEAGMEREEVTWPPGTPAPQASPLLQWLRDTPAPAPGLEALRRRLANISGSLSDTIDDERQDRL
jgi:hypothetical protein